MIFHKRIREENAVITRAVKQSACCICGFPPGNIANPVDPSHIKTRGSGGPDTIWNVVPKCRRHHREWEDRPHAEFFRRYPSFLVALLELGWDWDGHRLTHKSLLGERS